ncbi:hypothetical protein CL622_05060, partial [archaeon]|nr:hypothetical protein [archaeon]
GSDNFELINFNGEFRIQDEKSTRLSITNDGDIGIGTTTSNALLEINGNQTAGSKLAFNASGVLYVNESRVGIGTVSPKKLLHVGAGADDASVTETDLYISDTGQSTLSIRDSTNDVEAFFQVSTNGMDFGTYTDHSLRFFQDAEGDGSNPDMVIDSSGNVGIGTTAPNALLQVEGDQTAGSNLAFNASGVLYVNESNVGIGTTSPSEALEIVGNLEFSGGDAVIDTIGGWDISILPNNVLKLGTSATDDVIIGRTDSGSTTIESGGANALVVSSGNVGIGTTVPLGKFHVDTGEGELIYNNDGTGSVGRLDIFRNDTSITGGNSFGELTFSGADTTDEARTAHALIYADSDLTHAAGDNPTNLKFQTTSDGSATPTDRITIKDNGNVGIGTTTPSQLFEIQGGDPHLFIDNSNANGNTFIDINATGTGDAYVRWTGDSNTGLRFVNDTSSTNPVMALLNNGNIGIGTTNPNALLQVEGDQAVGSDLGFNASGVLYVNETNVGIGTDSPLDDLHIDGDQPGIYFTDTAGSSSIVVDALDANYGIIFRGDAGANHMAVLNTGDVGIGTTTPGARFEVVHAGSTETAAIITADATANDANYLEFHDIDAKAWELRKLNDVDDSDPDSDLVFRNGSTNTILYLDQTGDIGIGTAPTHKLEVAGSGFFDGDLNFTGDLVGHGTNVTVPDYVFESDYQLKSLAEVNEYIKEHKELPASTIQGRFVTDEGSNRIIQQQYFLLEKVEELTLYTLQQQQQIDQLKVLLCLDHPESDVCRTTPPKNTKNTKEKIPQEVN